ncbi:MAG: carboxylating nicotinate-nucleotide diphosphorylase [Candidatus Aminicenantes bacterium]|nr:carboxylating nicotinate-nucleotide diphosphorylase [Candidatus Aminicenantes bacterium]
MVKEEIDRIIKQALAEDMPAGDLTTETIIPPNLKTRAIIVAKESGVLAGIDFAGRVFELIDPSIQFLKLKEDGQAFKSGDILARIVGPAQAILKGERTALNFLQRLCGIATMTARFVSAVAGTKTRILDTRKTTPTLRWFEKYAVRQGGGKNHRLNLSEAVLIKDNHLKIIGSIKEAMARAKQALPPGTPIEVEVTSFKEAQEALEAGASCLLLDNMSLKEMKRVVNLVKGRIPLEASGKINLRQVRQIASLGIDYISVGRLTHSYQSIDLSLEIEEE